jgi:hypothetical protein
MYKRYVSVLAVFLTGILIGCSNSARKSADVSDNVQKSLNQSGLQDVSVSEDRDKGVVTLKGHVPSDDDKARAESIAHSNAPGLVVANEIEGPKWNSRPISRSLRYLAS